MTEQQEIAMKLALEALNTAAMFTPSESPNGRTLRKAITALTAALADNALNATLDKKAENAREIGLMTYDGVDYEPVAWVYLDQYGNLHESSSPTVPPETFPVYRHPVTQPAPVPEAHKQIAKHVEPMALQHWCTYCQGNNPLLCQFNNVKQWPKTYATNNTRPVERKFEDKPLTQAREDYQALQSALTRLQKRYADLEAKCQARESRSDVEPLTDEQCDAIYYALDVWSREFDQHEFGLPATCGGGMEGGRAIIRSAHGITGEKE